LAAALEVGPVKARVPVRFDLEEGSLTDEEEPDWTTPVAPGPPPDRSEQDLRAYLRYARGPIIAR
jgi:hypothetical protein